MLTRGSESVADCRTAPLRVHVGSLLTRETAVDASDTRPNLVISVRTLFPDTRPYDVFHG